MFELELLSDQLSDYIEAEQTVKVFLCLFNKALQVFKSPQRALMLLSWLVEFGICHISETRVFIYVRSTVRKIKK